MSALGHHTFRLRRGLAVVAGVFGLVTIFAAGGVLTGPGASLAGNTVALVLWTNLVLGPFYIVAAVLLWRAHPAARPLALALAGLTGVAALGFAVVALRGVAVEPRTGAALAFRILFWLALARLAPGRAA